MKQTYSYIFVIILAALVIAAPVMACDEPPAPGPGICIVAVDATSSGQASETQSITISHTTSGTDRLMLVGFSINDDEHETVSSITYNGATLTKVGYIDNSRSGGNDARVEIWRLIAPATGTHDVVITFSAPLAEQAVAGVMTFTGVDQTTPLGPFASKENDPSPATVTVSSATGELVFGVIADEYEPITTDSGQTERWNIHAGSSDTYGAGSTKAGASSVTLKWTVGSDAHWAAGGVSIKPCSSPIPPQTPPSVSFSCPQSTLTVDYQSLKAADGEIVGCVAITNDNKYLYVNVSSSPSVKMTMTNWTWIAATNFDPNLLDPVNGVPLTPKFKFSYLFKEGEVFHNFRDDISDLFAPGVDTDFIWVSAYAVVEKEDVQTCTWISSDKKETYAAYNNPKLGPDVSGTLSPRYGTAVDAYVDSYHSSSLYLATTRKPFTFTTGKWIWESKYVKNPWKGDIVDFTKTFTLGGVPVSGTLAFR
ncbi:MAG: hypothetical protein LUQ67_02430 [Methanomicrobiales archaeon]|nr:hypothetical protein [Methanomicrobiales archaeon]